LKPQFNVMHIVLSLECGGLEKLAIDLSENMNQNGFSARICCLENTGELENQANSKGIEVVLVKKRPGLDMTLLFRLARIMREKRIDLVHTHNMSPLLYGTLAAKIAGIPAVINTRHGREKYQRSPFIWNMNNAIVAISEDARHQMLRWNRFDKNKTRVIYNGIDVDKYSFKGRGNEFKKSLNLDSSTRLIASVARLSPEKDQFTLLNAFSRVLMRNCRTKMVIIGDGALRKELELYAEKLGLSKDVFFLGFRQDIPEILSGIDLFAVSSLMEGVSLTILEAMAAGLPIIATKVGGNPEVIVDGVTGILVSSKDPNAMADAIIKVLANAELAKSMGLAARRRVEEKFSLNRMANEYMDLYESCLRHKKAM